MPRFAKSDRSALPSLLSHEEKTGEKELAPRGMPRCSTDSLQALFVTTLALLPAYAQGLPAKVAEIEKKRIDVINKVKPSVVAVMARDLRGNLTGNGSGVLIDEEGYALTNWHVTNAARSPLLKCGLPDGLIYDAVLVGLDRVGDVALIKLLPRKPGDKFPYAKMGDSDKVKAGDWSLAMGNPFSLATDLTPTVTFGLVSGVHRYQYPAGTLLEYTDCIQVDTSINPGNSGGPLFNLDGELIGINGRISLERRGRVNVGVGYAISINQIKNFMGHLRVGLDTDHASLGASMESESEDGGLSRIVVKSLIESDARRRGLDVGDELVSFAGRPMTTVNQYKNVLGLYPKGWRVPLVYRREGERKEILVRLMGVQRGVINENGRPSPPPMPPSKGPRPPVPAGPPSPAAKFYKEKEGFVNYYFNEEAQKRVLADLARLGDFSKLTGDWKLDMNVRLLDRGTPWPPELASLSARRAAQRASCRRSLPRSTNCPTPWNRSRPTRKRKLSKIRSTPAVGSWRPIFIASCSSMALKASQAKTRSGTAAWSRTTRPAILRRARLVANASWRKCC
jgi:serine protease Do